MGFLVGINQSIEEAAHGKLGIEVSGNMGFLYATPVHINVLHTDRVLTRFLGRNNPPIER